MTIDEIVEGILEIMESCHAQCPCSECPIEKYCDEYYELGLDKKPKPEI